MSLAGWSVLVDTSSLFTRVQLRVRISSMSLLVLASIQIDSMKHLMDALNVRSRTFNTMR